MVWRTGCATVKADTATAQPRRHAWSGLNSGAMLSDASRLGDVGPEVFEPAHYGEQARPVEAGGRQAAWFVAADGWQGVLRGYRRGGLIARVSREAYIWTGESRTRSFREFRLLAALHQQGLRVPRPLAAGYWRHGLTYRAAIIVERIAGVRPLAHALTEPIAEAVAQAIVNMHRAGVWHADLNAFNILLDPFYQVWLIDFDRGTQGQLSESARLANLERLRRSLRKVGGEQGEAFWQKLQPAYASLWQHNDAK